LIISSFTTIFGLAERGPLGIALVGNLLFHGKPHEPEYPVGFLKKIVEKQTGCPGSAG
jgi:hypothetical protein